jgi:glycogen(starch) synthase
VRVLLTSQEVPPHTAWGGIGTYVGTIAPALARQGAEVHVLSVVEGQERGTSTLDGVHVHRAPLRRPRGVGRVTRMPATWRRLFLSAAVAREKRKLGMRFDVCEAPEWNAEGLAIALRGTTPLVIRLHSGARQVYPVLGPMNSDRHLAICCEEAAIRRADVVTGTKSLLAEAPSLAEIPRSHVRTIVYPVRSVERLPPPHGPPRVAFIGRFESRKGPDTLVRAIPRLAERIPQVRVVLRGTDTKMADGGSFRSHLERLVASLGVDGKVEITDHWRPGAVREELATANVCVVPSRWESFGLVAAEAAALGRPVVASRIAGLDEVVEDGVNGRLVPPEQPEAFADVLARLLDSPADASRMGEAGARLIASRCDPDLVARQTLEAYELAIASHRNGHRSLG